MGEDRLVRRDMRGNVLLLTFDRETRHNAWSLDLEREYFAALDDADADPEVRAIVVTGARTSFCPGMDMAVLTKSAAGDTSAYAAQPRRPLAYPLVVRKPMIAAVNGGCAGIGLLQALLCDVRFVADEARIASGSTTRGLPAEFGLSWILPRFIGHTAAVDLLLSGRTIDGAEAARLGLASRSVPRAEVVDTALAYAGRLATSCSPAAMAAVKRQLLLDWSSTRDSSVATGLAIFEQLRDGADFAEGVAAFTERRAPRFAPLQNRDADLTTPHLPGPLEDHVPAPSAYRAVRY